MTETAFPFGGDASQAPESAAVESEMSEGGADRRRLMFLAAGAGALVLLALVYFVFLKGGSSSNPPALVPHAAVSTHTASKPTTKAAVKKHTLAKVPSTFKDVIGRDPFKPLYVAPVQGATGGATAPTTDTSAPATDLGSSSGTTTTAVGTRVSLLRIYTKSGRTYATTKVNSTIYNVAVGKVFATSFKLVSVSGKTATYLDGDVQFTLREGQEVLK